MPALGFLAYCEAIGSGSFGHVGRYEDLLMVLAGAITAMPLIGFAYGARRIPLSMVGINYRWGGNSPQTGFDCSGLVSHVFRQIAGLVLPRDSYAMARLGRPVTLDDLRPGDLVFFNTMRKPFSHVGIYLGEKRFLSLGLLYTGESQITSTPRVLR